MSFFKSLGIFRTVYDIQNCIVDGGLQEELSLGIFKNVPDQAFFGDTLFNNNLVRTERKFVGEHHTNNKVNISPAFVDVLKHDYHLEATFWSHRYRGIPSACTRDFDEALRNGTPDAGAFEYKP